MQRVKCTIAYDGSGFSGYQIQPNKRTVQVLVEETLARMHKGERVRIFGSGRTDATVHAHGQVIHFDTSLTIPVQKWKNALNALLPKDIFVKDVEFVSNDFHARFNVVKKEYRYRVTKEYDVFNRQYAYHFPYQLDYEAIKEAMNYLVGTHDFTSFCSAKTEVVDKVRSIYEVNLIEETDEIVFRFVGNGFLYNMVRIMVGTLLEVGQNKINPSEIQSILEKRDRTFAGKTAPGHGLYLWKVSYDN
jgi:tRNA pseudouridine38-40 synthase